MSSIGAFEAKTHFSALLERVEHGEHIIITKHGHPVAKLIPVVVKDQASVRDAIELLTEFGKANTLKGLNWKKLRDEGRR